MSEDRNQYVASAKVTELEEAAQEVNAVSVPDGVRAALVKDLSPIADRIALYEQQAAGLVVESESDAKIGAEISDRIAADVKAVKDHEVLSRITDGLHKLHRRWTGLRDAFVKPLEASRKDIKRKVIAWQIIEQRKAQEEQRRLQAEADERARKEREALEKKAAAAKRDATKEKYAEAAQAVVTPTVVVEAPKTNLRVRKAWKVTRIDEDLFFASLGQRRDLRGYVTVDSVRMQRAKHANPMTEIPGVTFTEVVI